MNVCEDLHSTFQEPLKVGMLKPDFFKNRFSAVEKRF